MIYVGHDYPKNGRDFEFGCTVKREREENIHMKSKPSEEEYVKMRNERGKKKNFMIQITQKLNFLLIEN
jgi:hypothetical protein